MKLSILMPVYNEEASVSRALKLALAVEYPCEVEFIVVDDGSSDGTAAQLDAVTDERLRVVHHQRNKGKGAAIRTAVDNATGDYVVILDADRGMIAALWLVVAPGKLAVAARQAVSLPVEESLPWAGVPGHG